MAVFAIPAALMRPALLALALAGLAGARAEAGEVCNETSWVVEAAVAWRGQEALTAQGWIRLRPGECARTPPAPEIEQYLYARTSDAYLGGVREWRGEDPICVAPGEDFRIEGVADCAALGYEPRRFRRLAEEERRRAVLVEPDDFGARAQIAGVQRLLQAAGYNVRVVDGYEGRRTRREVAAFEADAGQSFNGDDAALIDALEEAARARNAAAGLQVCNGAGAPIGVAVARIGAEREESRGWWRIAPGDCARPLAARLEPGEAFVYAERLGDTGAAPLRGGAEAFCVAPARFLAEGRADCAARGYESRAFRALTEETGLVAGGARLTLRAEDFDIPDPDPFALRETNR